jgi:hypothetical protein
MAAFLVLYHGTQIAQTQTDDMEDEAELSRWLREISNSVLDGGSQTTDGMKVTLDDSEPLTDTQKIKNYLILEARNKDEALELSRSAPSLYGGGSAEVYEIATEA